ncbi:premnaspirodiene oxygenase [Eucalyptus grandis]|uniref:premnaspirodiene oxygenase n=1 Tax=Eucalyptus grandis TaxID=71139 RepID=UPI00192E781E|nr:premnaspirodiene oxygenase [Eucalyptus grandis]
MTGMNSKFRMLQRKIDSILDSILDDREIMRREQSLRSKDDTCGREDILDVLLRLRETNELGLNLTTRKIKGIIMDLFVAGSITTSTLIEWAMSELIRNPKVMAKAQAEVRAVLKEKGCLEESELNKLKYLLSIIKESFRLHPPVPLIPREATEEREINGYKVPASSRILTNVMAIGRDPHHWTDPEKFKPERFLESTMDFIGTNFELLPFGSGRRACPGIALANANIEVTLASLLYHFDWKLPNGEAMEKLDMTEAFAGTVTRMNSLNVIAIPYIPTVAA